MRSSVSLKLVFCNTLEHQFCYNFFIIVIGFIKLTKKIKATANELADLLFPEQEFDDFSDLEDEINDIEDDLNVIIDDLKD